MKEKYLDVIFPYMPSDTLRQMPVLASGQQVFCHYNTAHEFQEAK